MRKKWAILFLIIILLIFFLLGFFIINELSNQEIPKVQQPADIVYENGSIPKVYFCKKDNCEQKLSENIKNAKKYVYCAFFELNLNNLTNLFLEKSKAMDVRLVLDNQYMRFVPKTDFIRFDDEKQLMHNKFCVIDDYTVWTGSFNPTFSDNNRNDNNAILLKSKYIAANYKEEFNELWNGRFGKGEKVIYPKVIFNGKLVESYFCPEDNCEKHITDIIDSANKSVYFMTFSFTSEPIADSILFKNKNINVKGIFDRTQAASQYSQFKRLKDFGLNVKLDQNKYFMHHKVFIIDNETVITGSYNPTSSAEHKNDENILIFHDRTIANKYLQEFNSLFY